MYKVIEVVGTSHEGIESAIVNAIDKVNKSVNHLVWFTITETKGNITNGRVGNYKVTLKVGFQADTQKFPEKSRDLSVASINEPYAVSNDQQLSFSIVGENSQPALLK